MPLASSTPGLKEPARGTRRRLPVPAFGSAVAGSERDQRIDVGRNCQHVVLHPLGHLGEGAPSDDAHRHLVGVDGGGTQVDAFLVEQDPWRSGAAVRHPDAAAVDHPSPVDEAGERNVRVPATHDAHGRGDTRERSGPL